MKKNYYTITHIRDIRSLIEIRYWDNSEDILEFGEIKNLKERIDFEQKLRPAFEVIAIHKFSHSKRVHIFNQMSGETQTLLVRENTKPELYDLLEKFSFGSYMNGREPNTKMSFLFTKHSRSFLSINLLL
jgi:hypothetical protein